MIKALHSVIAGTAFLLLLTACSNEQAYNAVRDNRMGDCEYRQPTEREECLRHYEQTYEEYQREREALIKDQE